RKEVETILGGPPGDYTTRKVITEPVFITSLLEVAIMPTEWRSNVGTVQVLFDPATGLVASKRFLTAYSTPTILDRARTWMGWRILSSSQVCARSKAQGVWAKQRFHPRFFVRMGRPPNTKPKGPGGGAGAGVCETPGHPPAGASEDSSPGHPSDENAGWQV